MLKKLQTYTKFVIGFATFCAVLVPVDVWTVGLATQVITFNTLGTVLVPNRPKIITV